jgi:hypothetical protein
MIGVCQLAMDVLSTLEYITTTQLYFVLFVCKLHCDLVVLC